MCWAPEAIWDPVAGKYMVYFSSNEADSAANESSKIWYSYTSDFKNFDEKQLLFDPGYGVIDADITPYKNGYVMMYKKEASSDPGAKKVWYTFKTGKSPLIPTANMILPMRRSSSLPPTRLQKARRCSPSPAQAATACW